MIQDRLTRLRREMEKRSIAVYVVPTADFHESEYVGEHFKALFCLFRKINLILRFDRCWEESNCREASAHNSFVNRIVQDIHYARLPSAPA